MARRRPIQERANLEGYNEIFYPNFKLFKRISLENLDDVKTFLLQGYLEYSFFYNKLGFKSFEQKLIKTAKNLENDSMFESFNVLLNNWEEHGMYILDYVIQSDNFKIASVDFINKGCELNGQVWSLQQLFEKVSNFLDLKIMVIMEPKTKIVYKTYNPFIYLFLTKDDMELTLFYPYTQKYSIDLWENLNIYRFPSLNNDEILLGCLCKFKLDENLIMNYNEDLFTACGFCHQKFNIIDKRKIKNWIVERKPKNCFKCYIDVKNQSYFFECEKCLKSSCQECFTKNYKFTITGKCLACKYSIKDRQKRDEYIAIIEDWRKDCYKCFECYEEKNSKECAKFKLGEHISVCKNCLSIVLFDPTHPKIRFYENYLNNENLILMIYNDDEFKKRLCSYCKKREKIDLIAITNGHNDCRICGECLGKISKIDNCLDCGNLIERLDLTRLAYVRCVLEGCNKNIPENLMEIHQNLCKKKSAQIMSKNNQDVEVSQEFKDEPICETSSMMALDNSTPNRDDPINEINYDITIPTNHVKSIRPKTQDKEYVSSKNEDEKPQLESESFENTSNVLQSELDIIIKKMNWFLEFVQNREDKYFFFQIKNKKYISNLGIIFGFELVYTRVYVSYTLNKIKEVLLLIEGDPIKIYKMEEKNIEKMNSMTNTKNSMSSYVSNMYNYLYPYEKDLGVNSESINKNPSELTDLIQPQTKTSERAPAYQSNSISSDI